MPVSVRGGDFLIHVQRDRALIPMGEEGFDLWLATAEGVPIRRLLDDVDPASVHEEAVSPNGRYLVCLTASGAGPNLVLMDLETGAGRTLLTETAIEAASLCWDPGGRHVAMSFAREPVVALIDVTTWEFVRHPGEMVVHGWVPGEAARLLLGDGEALSVWEVEGGKPPVEVFRAPPGQEIEAARVDPDGRRIAVTVSSKGRSNAALMLSDLATGASETLWQSPRPLVGVRWAPRGNALFVSQLGRSEGSGWRLHRLSLDDRRPRRVAEHWGGWAVSPGGNRLTLATRRGLEVRSIAWDDKAD